MKITLNIEKRFAYVIIGVLIVVLGTLIVYSYGGTQPAVAGHTWGEIVCDDNMCVDVNNGRVGIGTNTPNNLLTVGTENNPFGVSSAGDIIVTGGTDNRWALYKPDGTEKFVIDSSGNINLFGPRLDVNGNIHATGDICTDQGGGKCLSSVSSGGTSISCNWNGWSLQGQWADLNHNGCVEHDECTRFGPYAPCDLGLGLYCSEGRVTRAVFCYQNCYDTSPPYDH